MHNTARLLLTASIILTGTCLLATHLSAQEPEKQSVRVFILAGQSNMAGHGVVDLDGEKDYNSGKGNLENVMADPKNSESMAHLKNADGTWRVRDDAFCWHRTNKDLKVGGVSIGFSGYEGEPHHFGPEMQFGHVLGDALDEPVLLIKTAWGGKSLFTDFRPPSSGGEVGPYYVKMLEQLGEAMENAQTKIPALKDKELVISGFVWQQGWNDMIDDAATAEYASNLKNFITDIRNKSASPTCHSSMASLAMVARQKGKRCSGSVKLRLRSPK